MVRHLGDHGTRFFGRIRTNKGPAATRKRADTSRLQQEPFHIRDFDCACHDLPDTCFCCLSRSLRNDLQFLFAESLIFFIEAMISLNFGAVPKIMEIVFA